MNYSQFLLMTDDAKISPSKDVFISERICEDWTVDYADGDNMTGVISILGAVYDIAQGGNAIRILIDFRGTTIKAFAKSMDIPLRTIENWCAESRNPPEYIINLITFAVLFH